MDLGLDNVDDGLMIGQYNGPFDFFTNTLTQLVIATMTVEDAFPCRTVYKEPNVNRIIKLRELPIKIVKVLLRPQPFAFIIAGAFGLKTFKEPVQPEATEKEQSSDRSFIDDGDDQLLFECHWALSGLI